MLTIDAQVHPWEQGTSTGHHRRDPLTAEVLIREMDEAGVDAAVLVPPLWDPEGNAYAVRAARAHPERFAVMGLLQMRGETPPKSGEDLKRWVDDNGLIGVRFLFNTPERAAPFHQGAYDWVWPAAEAAGIAVAVLVPGELPIAASIAERHPGLKLIVDHLGAPRGASGPEAFAHLPDLIALSRLPNLSVKAVAACDYAQEPYPFPSVEAPLRRVFEAFGPQRIMWGSDLSRLRNAYRDCVRHVSEALPWLSDDDRADVMGRNLCRVTGWRPVRGRPQAERASPPPERVA